MTPHGLTEDAQGRICRNGVPLTVVEVVRAFQALEDLKPPRPKCRCGNLTWKYLWAYLWECQRCGAITDKEGKMYVADDPWWRKEKAAFLRGFSGALERSAVPPS